MLFDRYCYPCIPVPSDWCILILGPLWPCIFSPLWLSIILDPLWSLSASPLWLVSCLRSPLPSDWYDPYLTVPSDWYRIIGPLWPSYLSPLWLIHVLCIMIAYSSGRGSLVLVISSFLPLVDLSMFFYFRPGIPSYTCCSLRHPESLMDYSFIFGFPGVWVYLRAKCP